jgi:hypothetical protein
MEYTFEDDDIISTDMYVKQQNYYDVTPVDDIEYHVTSYDTPTIDTFQEYTSKPWDDNAHLVFDVPKQLCRW